MALGSVQMAVLLAGCLLGAVCLECRKSRSLWMGLLLFCVFLGWGRLRAARAEGEAMRGLNLDRQKEISVLGTVRSLEEKTNGWGGELSSCRLEEADGGEELGTVSVFFEERPEAEPGDRLRVTGIFKIYDPASNPGEFDYQAYYDSKSMFWKMTADSWEKLPGGNPLLRVLGRVKERSAGILDRCGGANAGIFKAMLLGLKGDIPDEVYALYQESGISHLLAISGLHVSMLGMGLHGLLRKLRLGKRPAAALSGGFMVLYGIMTGFSPSTQRAVIMFLASMAAGWVGKTYDLASALSLAGAVILWLEPLALMQGGVQLSFLAVGGIGVLGRMLERGKVWEGRAGRLLLSGLAVQLATYPAVAYHFFIYPPYSIFLNLLVIPLMTYAMVSGLLCLAVGGFCPPLGRVCIGGGYYILECYEALCRLWGRLPGSSLVIGRPALWQIALYGAILILFAAACSGLRRKKAWLAGITAALFFLLFPLPVRGMRVTYLDVGQGDGIVAETGNCRILMDGGSSDVKRLEEQVLRPFLQSRGIRALDYAAVSHCDSDHISGLKGLLESGAVKIRTLILPDLGRWDEAWQELAALAEDRGTRVVTMKAGDEIRRGKLRLLCLYPYEGKTPPEDRNDQSLILQLSYGNAVFLFTGDTGTGCEEEMLQRPAVRAELGKTSVLKVAHHGSASSTGEEFLKAVQPAWGVISYGEGNSYGHPAPETTERLEKAGVRVLETARDGAVTTTTDGKRLKITWFLRGKRGLVSREHLVYNPDIGLFRTEGQERKKDCADAEQGSEGQKFPKSISAVRGRGFSEKEL